MHQPAVDDDAVDQAWHVRVEPVLVERAVDLGECVGRLGAQHLGRLCHAGRARERYKENAWSHAGSLPAQAPWCRSGVHPTGDR